MKASDYEKVAALMKQLRDVENDIVLCTKNLSVTLCERRLDGAIVDLVRKPIIAELQRRGRDLQDKLAKFGVTFERSGAFG